MEFVFDIQRFDSDSTTITQNTTTGGNNENNKITYDANVFYGTRSIRDLTKYLLMRGVTDFGDLEQYNLYESGYSFLNVLQLPIFIRNLMVVSREYDRLIKSYAHVLEFEFRGFEGGLDNITTDYGQLTNGINSINIINKVNKPSDSTFSATYQEKLGGMMTKFHELYISGIKDPRTEVKTYHGLIGTVQINNPYTIYAKVINKNVSSKKGYYDSTDEFAFDSSNASLFSNSVAVTAMEAGFENEIFKFMYIVTDNTLLGLEKAVYLAAAQLTNVPFEIYTGTKGTYEFKDISVEFNAYPVMCKQVNIRANQLLQHIYLDTCWREFDFNYESLDRGTDTKGVPWYKYNSTNRSLQTDRVGTKSIGDNANKGKNTYSSDGKYSNSLQTAKYFSIKGGGG